MAAHSPPCFELSLSRNARPHPAESASAGGTSRPRAAPLRRVAGPRGPAGGDLAGIGISVGSSSNHAPCHDILGSVVEDSTRLGLRPGGSRMAPRGSRGVLPGCRPDVVLLARFLEQHLHRDRAPKVVVGDQRISPIPPRPIGPRPRLPTQVPCFRHRRCFLGRRGFYGDTPVRGSARRGDHLGGPAGRGSPAPSPRDGRLIRRESAPSPASVTAASDRRRGDSGRHHPSPPPRAATMPSPW